MAVFQNQATLSYKNNVTSSNIVTGELVEVLSATKTPVGSTYTVGGEVTYVVSIINSGTTPISGVTVTDNLGEYSFGAGTVVPLTYLENTLLHYQNGVLQATPVIEQGDDLKVSGIVIPAGGESILVYKTRVNEFANPNEGGQITNQVVVSGDGISTTVLADATITPENEAVLSIQKGISPSEVAENGRLTYTFTITNTGIAAATEEDQIVISDLFQPVLSNIQVLYNGAVMTVTADYMYDETTGQFDTVAGVITVPAATYTQDETTGAWNITPGVTTVVVTGTV